MLDPAKVHFTLFLLYVYTIYSRYNTDCIANIEIDFDRNNSIIKRLWCIYIVLVFQGSVVPRTWQKVAELFDGSYRYETSKLKLILDGLMNAGMPQYLSVLEYSYSRNIALVVSFTVIFLNF